MQGGYARRNKRWRHAPLYRSAWPSPQTDFTLSWLAQYHNMGSQQLAKDKQPSIIAVMILVQTVAAVTSLAFW